MAESKTLVSSPLTSELKPSLDFNISKANLFSKNSSTQFSLLESASTLSPCSTLEESNSLLFISDLNGEETSKLEEENSLPSTLR